MMLSFLPLIFLAAAPLQAQTSSVRVAQSSLVAQCLDGVEIGSGHRSWKLPPGEHTLIVTMRNRPRPGISSADPGIARIRFTLVPEHRYDVEVRAPGSSFSLRVWSKGGWAPVVRDRTGEGLVSSEVEWIGGSGCHGPAD
jgi:hypothetical protein